MKNKIIILEILIALMMTSCIVYPQTSDIPLIKKKKDLRIDAGISLIPTAHATISYGLSDKIALQTFGSISSDYGYYFQGAGGYFKDLGNRKVIELYSGFGFGYGEAYRDSGPGHLYGNYQLYFTQFNFGKIDCKFANMDYGFGIKTGLLHSYLVDRNYYYHNSENTVALNSFIIEPTLFARLGGERLKFSLKLGSCWLYKFTNTDKYLPYSYFNLGLGLNYRF
jgi:hypothetical protein